MARDDEDRLLKQIGRLRWRRRMFHGGPPVGCLSITARVVDFIEPASGASAE